MKMNSPKIRFKGYTEDWEQRKLDDVTVKIGSGKTPSGGENAYVDAGIPLIRSQNVNDNKVDFEDIVYIDESTDKLMMNSRVFANDVLLNITGASIGRSAVYKGLDEGNVNQHVCIIRPIEGYHPDFIQLNLASDRGQKQIKSSQTGGGREGLNFQQIGKMKFVFPTLDEQKQIGNYFNNIDHLITLHQRKCEQTKTLKKYMLQKMFPQEGQKVPEIRFEGFTGDWEQRKLGEICEIKDSARIPNSEWVDSGVPYIRASDITNENLNGILFISKERYEFYKNRTGAPVKNDVLFNGGGEIGKSFLIMDERPIYVQGGAVLYACTSKANKLKGQYLKTYFETNQARSYIDAVSAGGTIKHFTLKPSQMMPILMPSVAEQEKIGNYFQSLNHLITLHQREYEKLQELKKFMLQNMFV